MGHAFHPPVRAAFAACLWVASGAAAAQDEPPQALAECKAIVDAAQRLACYDRLAGREAVPAPLVPAGRTPDSVARRPPGGPGLQAPEGVQGSSFLSKYWELDQDDKRGVFNFTGYRPNFLLPLHLTTRINTHPSSPTPGRDAELGDYKKLEAKVQISLRTKLVQNLVLPGADLWAAYTQQSLWQVYNPGESAPFRSNDYEPELMYVVPTPGVLRDVLPWGVQWRYGILAVAHQSNGQTEPLSRSWNRVYLGGGLERGDVSFTLRYNRRLHESASKDDNPDLLFYRGSTDLALNWTPGRATASLLWRMSPSTLRRGSVQFDYTYPVKRDDPHALRWYLQLFSGYGETLLDYNFRQTSLGLGLTLFEF